VPPGHDLAMVPFAWLGAYWLRYNLGVIPDFFWQQAWMLLPVVMVLQAVLFWYFGLYRGVWRFASMPDLMRILKAVGCGVLSVAAAAYGFTQWHGVPRSAFILYGLLLIGLLGGPRFAYRLFKDWRHYRRTGKNVLIVGAGRAGEMLARDLLRDLEHGYTPVGFVDDDPAKHGKDIHGLPVVGTCVDIPAAVNALDVDLLMLALPSADRQQLRRIVDICESTGRPFRTLPRMQDLVTGQVSLRDLRDVKIDDLLGRDVVSLDWQAIGLGTQEKTILVSGGGGSIGSELCRQLARLRPRELILLERSEFNLYSIELELRREFPKLPLVVALGDVNDAATVEQVLRRHRPQLIFHAAAYKHVPLLEEQTRAAVVNNVFGTRTLASLADRYACETFVMISTDKAVHPTNVMGASKRVAEIVCQAMQMRSKTRFITVRFGNVLGSTGSVIPLFQNQIASGGPVTVTHPEITRYFMTIAEATQLILQASVLGRGGEIFVLDMGEPVKIAYLAEQLILLSGKKPGVDIEVVYTGLRPGEKLREELFYIDEKLADTAHPKIMLARGQAPDAAALDTVLALLDQACHGHDAKRIRELLNSLIPPADTAVATTPGAKRPQRLQR
jgi:FlaA1/EpsC-like NDP-sugar epimerase